MEPEFADICGISKEELTGQLGDYIDAMAEANGCTYEKMLEELTYRYDGYHFTWPSPDIFNPFSIINAFSDKRLGNYWFGSGTPTFLIEMMRKFNVAPSEIGNRELGAEDFDSPAESLTSIVPLLYQSGYITIKNYDPIAQLYTLDIPNIEIKTGLLGSLLPHYVQAKMTDVKVTGNSVVRKIYTFIYKEDMEQFRQLYSRVLNGKKSDKETAWSTYKICKEDDCCRVRIYQHNFNAFFF